MNLKFHSSVLFVKDTELSKQFYCRLLEQEIETDFGNNIALKGGLSLWQIQEGHSLHTNFYNKTNKNGSLELYFEIEDITTIIELIEKEKIPKHHELTVESWGQKTIRLFDPDDNLVEIGEKTEVFIKRMYQEGLTFDEINSKTGVPIELIQEYIK